MKYQHILKSIRRKVYDHLPLAILKKMITLRCKSYCYPVVLLFHHIIPEIEMTNYANRFGYELPDIRPLSITPEKFEEIIESLKNQSFSFLFEDEYKKEKEKQAILSFDDGYIDNYLYAYPIIRNNEVKASINLISDNLHDKDDGEYLSINRIIEMSRSGVVQFQAHTVSHPILTQCSMKECRREIEDCKREFHNKLGIDASVFVYPCGQMNKEICDCVKNNYSFAYGGDDIEVEYFYRIPRIEIDMSFDEKKLYSEMLFSLTFDGK